MEIFKNAGIAINEEQKNQLEKLCEFMLEYNKKVNLTRITEIDEIREKHYLDSVLPLTMWDVEKGEKCADIGAGAGFPSLPMKIYRSDLDFTLVDSLNKRVAYLEQACRLLGLDCKAVHGRSEELGHNPIYREKFGMVTARAVANLAALSEYCLPFVKVGGVFLAMKGSKDELDELAKSQIKKLGGEIEKVIPYALPSGDGRTLIVIRKLCNTPKVFPRTPSAIQKMTKTAGI